MLGQTQGQNFPAWVTDKAGPVLFRALSFEVVLLLMWLYATMFAPYPKADLDAAFTIMLGKGNNSEVSCGDEGEFWASFTLPFEWGPDREPLDCNEPTCGYKSWQALCEARRLAPLALATRGVSRSGARPKNS